MNNSISDKQLAANRQNAMKSTGPRTRRGKLAASRNALKFGVLAEAVVVRGHTVKESARDYEQLCRELHESLRPTGMLEEMLTGQIAAVTWRLRRARQAESGEIALSVDGGQTQRDKLHEDLLVEQWKLASDMARAMEDSTMGNNLLISWLKEVQTQVQQEGKLTEASVKIPCHGRLNSVSTKLGKIRLALAKRYEEGDEVQNAEKEKTDTLDLIEDMILEKNIMREECEKREEAEEEARQSAAVLPAEETLGKIMRYEAGLERQLFRAMNQLERLQDRRLKNGEKESLPEKDENAKRTHFENDKTA